MENTASFREQERRVAYLLRIPREQAFAELREESDRDGDATALVAEAELDRWGCDFGPALEKFARALEIQPDSIPARAGYIFLYEKGEKRLARLAELAAGAPELERPRLYLGFAHTLAHQGQEAVEDFKVCTELLPEDPSAWAGFANALLAVRDRDAAAMAAEHLVRLCPNSVQHRTLAAQALLRARYFSRAFALARANAREFPNVRRRLAVATLPLTAWPMAFVAIGIAYVALAATTHVPGWGSAAVVLFLAYEVIGLQVHGAFSCVLKRRLHAKAKKALRASAGGMDA